MFIGLLQCHIFIDPLFTVLDGKVFPFQTIFMSNNLSKEGGGPGF
jgi:hypothetical protein